MGIVLGLPFACWLSGCFGDYRVYCAAFIGFAVGSFACAMSENIYFFVVARFFPGLCCGVALPIGQTIALNEYPERFRFYGVTFWGVLSMLLFTLDVFMVGFCAEYFDWRGFFYSNIILSAIIAAFVYAFLYGRSHIKRMTRFNVVGVLLLTILFVGTQTILNQGNDFDWFGVPFLLLLLIVVIICLPLFHILGNGRTPSHN